MDTFLKKVMAESILRTKYGLLGQWIEEVSSQEGMKHRRALSFWENIGGWATGRKMKRDR